MVKVKDGSGNDANSGSSGGTKDNDYFPFACLHCKKKGHKVANCPQPRRPDLDLRELNKYRCANVSVGMSGYPMYPGNMPMMYPYPMSVNGGFPHSLPYPSMPAPVPTQHTPQVDSVGTHHSNMPVAVSRLPVPGEHVDNIQSSYSVGFCFNVVVCHVKEVPPWIQVAGTWTWGTPNT